MDDQDGGDFHSKRLRIDTADHNVKKHGNFGHEIFTGYQMIQEPKQHNFLSKTALIPHSILNSGAKKRRLDRPRNSVVFQPIKELKDEADVFEVETFDRPLKKPYRIEQSSFKLPQSIKAFDQER